MSEISENGSHLSGTNGTKVWLQASSSSVPGQVYIDTVNIPNHLFLGRDWYFVADDTVDDIITLLQYRQAYRKQEGLYDSSRKLPDTTP